MRLLVPALLVALLVLGGVGALAWSRAEEDRTAGLEEQVLGMAEVLRVAAVEATTALEAAEATLADRLAAAARRADVELDATRQPARDVLARLAREERLGRAALLDPAGALAALARWPEALPAVTPESAALRERADALEREDLEAAARRLAPAPGQALVEGLLPNRFASRERFGVAYGRRDGGRLLLRADADALAALKHRFGVGPILDRVRREPGVLRARLLGEGGQVLLDAPEAPAGERAVLPGGGWPAVAGTEVGPGTLRAVVPFPLAEGQRVAVDLTMSTARADAAVARSRGVLALGLGLGGAGLAVATLGLSLRERRRRRVEAEERRRREDERRLAEMGALTALVTHELSNPLNAVRLGLALLQGDAPAADRRRVVATLEDQVARMGTTLEGFLDLAREPRATGGSVAPALLGRVAERVTAQARERGVALEVEVAPGAGPVPGDALVLEQALTNLARNAILAAPRASRVRLGWERAPDGGALVTVEDAGPGFPAGPREGLLRLGAAGRAGGHGLGLPLADRFVRQHGGRLTLLDRPGGGARVEVRLPPGGAAGGPDGGA